MSDEVQEEMNENATNAICLNVSGVLIHNILEAFKA